MENKIDEKTPENQIEEVRPNRESKSKNLMYTAMSVVLFFAIYFGFKTVTGYLNREYYVMIDANVLSVEQMEYIDEYTGILTDENCTLYKIFYEKTVNGNFLTIAYKNIEDTEKFVTENIIYEYGNVVEYDRYVSKTWRDDESVGVIAQGYVNIENPMMQCIVFENSAEYTTDNFSAEIMTIIKKGEKVYD